MNGIYYPMSRIVGDVFVSKKTRMYSVDIDNMPNEISTSTKFVRAVRIFYRKFRPEEIELILGLQNLEYEIHWLEQFPELHCELYLTWKATIGHLFLFEIIYFK